MIYSYFDFGLKNSSFQLPYQRPRTSGKGAMRAIVGSNLYCSLLDFKSPLMCIVGKQQKDQTPRSVNYCLSQISGCYSLRCLSWLTKTLR